MNNYRLKYITAVFIYGTIGYFLNFINLPSEIVVLGRGLIGSLFIYLYLKISGKGLDHEAIKNNFKYLVLSGVSLGLNWVFLFAAYTKGTVAIGSLCNYMAPIILILLSPFLYKEKLTPLKLACVTGAFAGIVLVSGFFNGEIKAAPIGIILGLLAALAFVLIVIFNRKLNGVPVYDKVVVQLFVSALTVLPYVLINNVGKDLCFDTRSVLLILLLGVFHTGIAYCLYFGSINEIPIQTMGILGYLEPVIAVLTSALLLHEPLGINGIIGAVLILVSACISEVYAGG